MSASSASRAAARIASSSSASLTARSASIAPPAGTSSIPARSMPAEPPVVLDAHVRVVEGQAQVARAGQPLDHPGQQVDGDLALPRRIDLLGRLREVAEVGDEAPAALAPDDRGGVAAGEAGQPAHVDEVGDEQHVGLALLQRLGDAVGAVACSPPWARQPSSSSFRRSSAARYPSIPWPLTVATHRSRTTDSWRHSSRLADVGEVDLDGRQGGDLERVADRPRVVRPRAGVHDDGVRHALEAVQVLDELALGVGLEEAHAEARARARSPRPAAARRS